MCDIIYKYISCELVLFAETDVVSSASIFIIENRLGTDW